jgi:hypothetical protein
MTSWLADTADCDRRIARGQWGEDRLRNSCRWPVGPWNTASNLAYVVAGAVVYWQRPGAAAAVMALALVALGLGSAAYHAWKTLWANRLDHIGMYLVFGALPMYAMAPDHPATPWLMATTGIGLVVLFIYVSPQVSMDIQMALLFWFSGLPALLLGDTLLAATGIGCFVVSYAAWHLDRRPTPALGRYGHAVWHLGTAAGIPLLFLARKAL